MVDTLKAKAKTLYDNKDYKGALEVYEELKLMDQNIFEKSCIFNYMWCLYRDKINNKDAFLKESLSKTREYVDYIMEHLTKKDLLFQMTVFKVLKFLKSRPTFDAEKINNWLDKLDPNMLSDEVYYYEVEGKRQSKPSNKEEWYALKSKACEKLEIFSECLKVSEEALNIFPELHNSNDIWFKRRIAISKYKLGITDEAIGILKELLNHKKDWFIYKDISDIYCSLNDYEQAMNYALDAVLRPGEDDKKINLFWDIGTISSLLNNTSKEEVFKNYSVKLRLINDWKLSAEARQHYENNKDRIDTQSNREMSKNILILARKYKWENAERHLGVIYNILPNNKAGFIKDEKGSYYFKLNEVKGRRKENLCGRKVEFYLEKAFDKKKNKETENAVNINIMD